MGNEFGRRLRDLVEGIRAEAEGARLGRAGDLAAARARRRRLEKLSLDEAARMLREADPVFAGLGLRGQVTPEEIRVASIPGTRPSEKFPPWLLVRCRVPAMEDAQVAVLEVTWRVDDPRTPLPESPSVLRFVASDDSPAGVADVRDFLSVAFEDFAAAVARTDALPRT
jgi:hypothetical protein